MRKHSITNHFKDSIYIALGILSATFALNSLLVPNQFLDGGVTGISLLLSHYFHAPLSIIIVLANIPFIILGAFTAGKKFAIKTFVSIIVLGLCLQFAPISDITADWTGNMILVSLFGGFFIGLGVGLGMRGGCSIDGIEILAIYTKRKIGFTMSELILALNVIIFLIAAFSFGMEKAFYAILTYYVATRTIGYVVEGIEEYTGITIISEHSESIKSLLVIELGKGISVYKGQRGFMKENFDVRYDCDIVFTIVTRFEVRRVRNMVHLLDPKAFVFTHTIKETAGGVLKKVAADKH